MAITFDVNLPGMPWKASISADGIYLSVAHYYSPYITIYKRNGEAFTKLADPASLPPAGGEACYDCSMSADGVYLAVAHYGSPRISIYKRSGDTFTKLADPTGGLPSDIGWGCALSPDATYLAVRHAGSPYLSLYKRTGDAFSRITDPTPAIGAYAEGSNGVCFSSDAAYLVVSKSTAPFFKIYKRAGDIFTGIADPTALPHARVYRCLFSPDDVHLVVSTYSVTPPYFIVYKRSGDTFTKLTNPTQPDFTEETLEPHIRGLAFSGDGSYLGIAFLGIPNAFIYARVGDKFSKQAVPIGLPSLPHRGMTIAFFDAQRHAVLGTATGVPPVSHPNFTGSMSGFEFSDALAHAPILYAPINSYLSLASEILFSWSHNIDSGTKQTQADLQYRVTGGEWTSLIVVTGEAQSVLIPANTFISGAIQWRARTYNDDGIPSDWADPVSFMAVGIPASPSILSVSDVSRPTVTWSSWDQSGYQLQILKDGIVLCDSGETAGVEKSLKVPIYLANDTYTARLRTINPSLFWSNWSEIDFSLDVEMPPAPEITVSLIPNGVQVIIDEYDESIVRAYLLRNNIPIAEITNINTYNDYAALGTSSYTVWVVNAEDNFGTSNQAIIYAIVSRAVLAAVDALPDMISMYKKASGQAGFVRQLRFVGTEQRYAGREFPVHVFSEFADANHTLAFYYTYASDFVALEQLLNRRKTLLYRDCEGNKFYGTISEMSHTQEGDMFIFTLPMIRVDYVERIDFLDLPVPTPEPEPEPELEELKEGDTKLGSGKAVKQEQQATVELGNTLGWRRTK